MDCMICYNDYGWEFCDNDKCSYLTCKKCNKKLDKCPHCNSNNKINMFFAGKILALDYDENKTNDHKYTVSVKRRGYVVMKENDKEYLIRGKSAGLDLNKNDIICYEDFMNLSKELPILNKGEYNLTGPFVTFDDYINASHGSFVGGVNFKNIKDNENIVRERNTEQIKKCHVFCMELNYECDMEQSKAEWGRASGMGKILLLEKPHYKIKDNDGTCYDNYNYYLDVDIITLNEYDEETKKRISNFHMYASESIETLEKVSLARRDAILEVHPQINMNYYQYKREMEAIIESHFEYIKQKK